MGEGTHASHDARRDAMARALTLLPTLPLLLGAFARTVLDLRYGLSGAVVIVAAIMAAAGAHLLVWNATARDQQHRDELAADRAIAERVAKEQRAEGELRLRLARRNHALLERQIAMLVELEHAERDPDGLNDLFRLDHLATRMRRNAESLVALSGEAAPRRWSRPVALADVVRAAVAEVEDYTRASIVVDESLKLAGGAVADVAHLLAELVENAVAASSGDGRVMVRTQPGRGDDPACLVTVEDRGQGLSDAAREVANRLLADPEAAVAAGAGLGLAVVARLAARHGVVVSLAATPGGGVTAIVRLPSALLPADDAAELLRRLNDSPVAPVRPDAGPMAGPGVAAAPLRAVPAAAVAPKPLVDPASLPVAARTAAVLAEPAPAAAAVAAPVEGAVPSSRSTVAAPAASLRRRMPGVTLAAAAPIPLTAPPDPRPLTSRSPEEVRAMLSRFQSSQAAGRSEAGER